MKKLPWYIWAMWWGFLAVAIPIAIIASFVIGFLGPIAAPVVAVLLLIKTLPATTKNFEIEIRKRSHAKS